MKNIIVLLLVVLLFAACSDTLPAPDDRGQTNQPEPTATRDWRPIVVDKLHRAPQCAEVNVSATGIGVSGGLNNDCTERWYLRVAYTEEWYRKSWCYDGSCASVIQAEVGQELYERLETGDRVSGIRRMENKQMAIIP